MPKGAQVRDRLTWERPRPVTGEELQPVFGELREALAAPGVVAQACRALEYLLVPRGSKLFDEAVELQYTFPLPTVTSGRCSSSTPSGIRTRDLHLERVTS